jgi:hypothetical protein
VVHITEHGQRPAAIAPAEYAAALEAMNTEQAAELLATSTSTRRCHAAVSPAIPAPTTMTSASQHHGQFPSEQGKQALQAFTI